MSHAVVVGGGVVGLTTAVRLLEAGWSVQVVTADPVEGTTSHLAAAVWFPTHAGPPERVAAWSHATYRVLAGQAADPLVPAVLMRESLTLGREPLGSPAWASSVGPVRPAEPGELPAGYSHGLRYAVPLVEMPAYLPWLVGEVSRLGGRVERRRVSSWAELSAADLIVNCTGLGARELAGDDAVHPVRGQVLRVTNPGLTMSVRDESHPLGRAYVHPRAADCVLGGTLDVDNWSTEPDPDVAQSIWERCLDIEPRLIGAKVLAQVVGLRPGRPEVRLEVDAAQPGGDGRPRLVHNYGHGGSGVTVGWGCADEVVALAEA